MKKDCTVNNLTLAAVSKNNEYIPPSKLSISFSIIWLICINVTKGLVAKILPSYAYEYL